MIKNNISFTARDYFYYARELMYNNYYDKAIEIFNKVLSMDNAWIENKISACLDLHFCYTKKNEIDNALNSLLLSFKYSTPRAEVCCKIADYFVNIQSFEKAIFWYTMALNVDKELEKNSFTFKDYYDFIPYISLCVCYANLKDYTLANMYNEKAGSIYPTNNIYLNNKEYLKEYLKS